MAWIYVLLAAVIEVFWVIGLKYSNTVLEWAGTVVAILFSFFFVIRAFERLPSGTVYAVFTGLGAAAIVVIDAVYFGASLSFAKIVFICLIVIGVAGIQLTTSDKGGN